jgi:hypothetical protein
MYSQLLPIAGGHLSIRNLTTHHAVVTGYHLNTETLFDPSKEVCLEINTEKTKYMLLSHHQQNHDVKRPNMSFENVAQFKSIGTTKKSKSYSGGN